MKTIVFILLAFGFAKANVQNYGLWIPKTESVFNFEATFPNYSPAGLRIKTEVRVQAFGDHTLRMKFQNSQIYHKINGTLDITVGRAVSMYILGYLEETVLVQLKRGHVKTFYVGAMEPIAVTNIKRAFLSKISLGLSGTKPTTPKTSPPRAIIEILRKGSVSGRLPLPSKTRKETSLLPTSLETKASGSLWEGPLDQIRLCDSDKNCPVGERCVTQCLGMGACVTQCMNDPFIPEKTISTNPDIPECYQWNGKLWFGAGPENPSISECGLQKCKPCPNYQLTKWIGRCDDINLASITDEKECKHAAVNAGETYKGLSKDYPGFEYYNPLGRLLPTGCFLYGNQGVYFNSNPPCSSFCAGPYPNTKSICKQDVSCSTWPKPQAQTHGCDGAGTAPLKVLDPLMKSSDSASCERLCARERENGCCYLNTGEGCSWRPGGYSTKRNSDIGISINCNRADCADDLLGYRGYVCSEYEKYCSDSYEGDWYRKFRAACKSTCSRYASEYCNSITCTGCVDEYLGYDMAKMKDGYDCKDYMVQCRSDYTSEWSKKVKGACKKTCSGYAAEYCYQNSCNGTSYANYHTLSQGTIFHDKDAMKPPKTVPGAIAKRVADAATWTWDFMKTPFA